MYTKPEQMSSYQYHTLIDWLSFTVPLPEWKKNATIGHEISAALDATIAMPPLDAVLGRMPPQTRLRGLKPAKPRFPYKNAMKTEDGALRVFLDRNHDHALFEISGQGCQLLRDGDTLQYLLPMVVDRLSRIDLAYDVLCWDDPLKVYDEIPANKFRSSGHQASDTGTTVYVGSKRSDRYARIYRYSYPHPRHEYLRFEMVFRKKQAINVGKQILATNVRETVGGAGVVFGFDACKVWRLESKEGIEAYRPERTRAKSERWFYAQVVPAIRRMLDDGTLTKTEVTIALLSDGGRDE